MPQVRGRALQLEKRTLYVGRVQIGDWTVKLSTSELAALLWASSSHTRKARDFIGHEHLDRTRFIHMNGRL